MKDLGERVKVAGDLEAAEAYVRLLRWCLRLVWVGI